MIASFLYNHFMKMRLKPLRGQTYGLYRFLEIAGKDKARVITPNDSIITVDIDELNLPIIDTRDYEKIADEKYKGD